MSLFTTPPPPPPHTWDPLRPAGAALDPAIVRTASSEVLTDLVEAMVLHPGYPCLGARSVFQRGRATVRVYDRLGSAANAETIRDDLREFAATTDLNAGFASFVALFRDPFRPVTELRFERLLWRQLEQLHEADDEPWSPSVSDDPANPHFAFSVAGTAYFVVGLHPGASRVARRAPLPMVVLNLHEQFDTLRASSHYTRMRDTIRRRDVGLQGSVNPMVADHGVSSEARQYSGRVVPPEWSPPFQTRGDRQEG